MSDETEGTTTEQPTDAPELSDIDKELAAENKLEADLKGSMPDRDELLGLDTEEAEAPHDDSGDDEPDDKAEPETPETPAAADGDRGGEWTWSGIRRARREIGSQREQLMAEQHRLQQEQAQYLAAQQRLQQLGSQDPVAAFREAARLAGVPENEWYQRVTEARLLHGTPEEQAKAQSPETRELQARLAAIEAAQKKREEQAQQQAVEQIRQQEAAAVYQVALHGADDGQGNRTEYQYLAALPPEQLEAAVRSAVEMAAEIRAEQGIVRTIGDVCSVLDQQARKVYEYQHSRHQKRLQASSEAAAPGGNGASQESSTDEDNPVGDTSGRRSERKQRKPRSPGNRAGAGTSPGARPKTQDEIDDELERQLRDGFQGYIADLNT